MVQPIVSLYSACPSDLILNPYPNLTLTVAFSVIIFKKKLMCPNFLEVKTLSTKASLIWETTNQRTPDRIKLKFGLDEGNRTPSSQKKKSGPQLENNG